MPYHSLTPSTDADDLNQQLSLALHNQGLGGPTPPPPSPADSADAVRAWGAQSNPGLGGASQWADADPSIQNLAWIPARSGGGADYLDQSLSSDQITPVGYSREGRPQNQHLGAPPPTPQNIRLCLWLWLQNQISDPFRQKPANQGGDNNAIPPSPNASTPAYREPWWHMTPKQRKYYEIYHQMGCPTILDHR